MQTLFQRLNDIINPGFRYFSEESAAFQQGKRKFEIAVRNGDVSAYVDLLEEEYRRVRASGSQDYKNQIHCLATEIKTAAWKNRVHNIQLTNEEIQLLKILLSDKGNLQGADQLIENIKGKLNEKR